MSPEQAFGEKNIDARADLWAVGVILYECLSGRRPTEAENMGQVLKILAHLSFPPIERAAPNLPAGLAPLVAALLCERDRRMKTAAEVRHELLATMTSGRIRARPPGSFLRTGIAVAAVSLVGFLIIAFFAVNEADSATDLAENSVSESGFLREVQEPTPVVPALSAGTTAPSPVPSTSGSQRPKDSVRLARPKITQPAVSAPASSFVPPSSTADPTKLMTEPPF
jgi:serine/threonine-protein kinase